MAPKKPQTDRYAKTPSTLERATSARPGSFLAKIIAAMNTTTAKLIDGAPEQKDNKGKWLAECFMWDEIAAYAKAMSDDRWERIEEEGIIEKTKGRDPGDYILGESKAFVCSASVSAKVMRFNPDKLAEILKKSHKVPEIITKAACEDAKVPSTSQTRCKIMER